MIAVELFYALCALVIVLAVVSLCLFFRLRDIIKSYNKNLRVAERKAFHQAMQVKLLDSDAYHAGYIKAMQEIKGSVKISDLPESFKEDLFSRLGGK